jgi:predicted nuclease of predicted toxin-antitoxin system
MIRQKSFLYGHPPKIIWLSVGNVGTKLISDLLTNNLSRIHPFAKNSEESLLILELPEGKE